MYIETMEEVLAGAQKIILDGGVGGGSGVVPYLPLNELMKPAANTTRSGTNNSGGNQ